MSNLVVIAYSSKKSQVEIAQISWQFHQNTQSTDYTDSLPDVPLEPHLSYCAVCIE